MTIDDLDNLLAEHEEFLQQEFSKMRGDLRAIKENFADLNRAIEEEESFLTELKQSIDREEKNLESERFKENAAELARKAGGIDQAVQKIDQEIAKITEVTAGISGEWDVKKPVKVLQKMVEDLEILKKRWNQVKKQRKSLLEC